MEKNLNPVFVSTNLSILLLSWTRTKNILFRAPLPPALDRNFRCHAIRTATASRKARATRVHSLRRRLQLGAVSMGCSVTTRTTYGLEIVLHTYANIVKHAYWTFQRYSRSAHFCTHTPNVAPHPLQRGALATLRVRFTWKAHCSVTFWYTRRRWVLSFSSIPHGPKTRERHFSGHPQKQQIFLQQQTQRHTGNAPKSKASSRPPSVFGLLYLFLFLPYYLAQLCGEANGQKAIVVFGALFGRPHAFQAIYMVL